MTKTFQLEYEVRFLVYENLLILIGRNLNIEKIFEKKFYNSQKIVFKAKSKFYDSLYV